MKETAANKPSIGPEPRQRIKAFATAVEALQKDFGVEVMVSEDGVLSFVDTKRTDDWNGYGEYDAWIKSGPVLRARLVTFENFDLWGK